MPSSNTDCGCFCRRNALVSGQGNGGRNDGETGLNHSPENRAREPRIAAALLAAAVLAAAVVCAVPRAVERASHLDDPSYAANRALEGTFSRAVAEREIEAALSAQDPELARAVAMFRRTTIADDGDEQDVVDPQDEFEADEDQKGADEVQFHEGTKGAEGC